jgi:WD40 repeat protein
LENKPNILAQPTLLMQYVLSAVYRTLWPHSDSRPTEEATTTITTTTTEPIVVDTTATGDESNALHHQATIEVEPVAEQDEPHTPTTTTNEAIPTSTQAPDANDQVMLHTSILQLIWTAPPPPPTTTSTLALLNRHSKPHDLEQQPNKRTRLSHESFTSSSTTTTTTSPPSICTPPPPPPIPPHQSFIKGTKWSPDGTCLLVGCDDNRLRLFELYGIELHQALDE